MNPNTEPTDQLREIHSHYELDPQDWDTLQRAYAVFRQHQGPFITGIAASMLDDLRADVQADPNRQIAFVGRDGLSLAVATAQLDPELFETHCHQIVLSRALVEAAVVDRETHAGETFPQLTGFRGRAVAEANSVPGASQRLTRYLRGSGLPVGHADSAVTLVDTSFKGTVQEMVAALYPDTTFTGRYAFFSASPDDWHPGTKHGYVLHRDADESWQGIPWEELPDDRALTFGAADAVATIEETMHGPLTSPKVITDGGPHQQPQHAGEQPLAGLNPVRVAAEYRGPRLRDAVKAAALLAVDDAAAAPTQLEQAHHQQALEHYTDQVRAWITGNDHQLDPSLGQLLDSFVRRSDRRVVDQLGELINQKRMGPEQAHAAWQKLDRLGLLEKKQQFVQTLRDEGLGPQSQAARAANAASAGLRPTSSARRSTSTPSASNPTSRPTPPTSHQQRNQDGPQQGR